MLWTNQCSYLDSDVLKHLELCYKVCPYNNCSTPAIMEYYEPLLHSVAAVYSRDCANKYRSNTRPKSVSLHKEYKMSKSTNTTTTVTTPSNKAFKIAGNIISPFVGFVFGSGAKEATKVIFNESGSLMNHTAVAVLTTGAELIKLASTAAQLITPTNFLFLKSFIAGGTVSLIANLREMTSEEIQLKLNEFKLMNNEDKAKAIKLLGGDSMDWLVSLFEDEIVIKDTKEAVVAADKAGELSPEDLAEMMKIIKMMEDKNTSAAM